MTQAKSHLLMAALLLVLVAVAAYPEDCDLHHVWQQDAEAGNTLAQVLLARRYARGECVPENPEEAVRWARLAAQQGDPVGQYFLGEMYRTGHGPLTQSFAEAAYWYRLAAEQDHPDVYKARYLLGVLYLWGRGVPQDFAISYAWLNVAAVHDERASGLRSVVAAAMTAEQIAEGQRLARELWERIQQPAAYSDEIVEYFLEVALGFEYAQASREDVIRKWPADKKILVSTQVDGDITAQDQATLAQVIEDLNELIADSGTHLELTESSDDVDIWIHFAPQSTFPQLVSDYVPGNAGFFWLEWVVASNEFAVATVLLANDQHVKQALRSHLIREELTQAMGLARDSSRYPQSIFYRQYSTTAEYAPIDRELIRLLYHPDVRPGMGKGEVVMVLESLLDG